MLKTMCDLTDFFERNPLSRKIKSFDEEEIFLLTKYNLPVEIAGFLKLQGLSTYSDDFFWTTLPQEHFQTFSEWGLNGKQCFAFLKTALGSLCYFYKGKIYQLEPISGSVYKGRFDFYNFMNLLVPMDAFMESAYFDIYQKRKSNTKLKQDEIYGFFPALALGGSFESSEIKIVNFNEHLSFLAQANGNKAKKI